MQWNGTEIYSMFSPACYALWSQIDCWMKSNTQSIFVQHWMLNANYRHSYPIALISMTLIWKNAAVYYDALWPHSIININKYWLAQIYMHPPYYPLPMHSGQILWILCYITRLDINQGDIDKLEAVQNFALKLISRRWDLGYEEMLSIANVPRLGERRQHLKLAQVFKIIHGLCCFPENIFMMQPPHSSRLSKSDTLLCPFARTIISTLLCLVLS